MKRSLQLNPHNRPATWGQIKEWRDTHEQAPVETSQGLFDCGSVSEARMVNAIAVFDELPTVIDGRIKWKRGDNTFVWLTKEKLDSVISECRLKRAKRAAQLHLQAEVFKAMEPTPTYNQLACYSFWLTK